MVLTEGTLVRSSSTNPSCSSSATATEHVPLFPHLFLDSKVMNAAVGDVSESREARDVPIETVILQNRSLAAFRSTVSVDATRPTYSLETYKQYRYRPIHCLQLTALLERTKILCCR